MFIYIFVFIISLLLLYLGYKFENKSKALYRLFIACGILLPCILAGIRAINIGADTKGYVFHLFELSRKSTSINDFIITAKSWYDISDYLYLFLNYFISHIFGSFKLFLFIVEFLIIFPIFKSLDMSKKTSKEVILGMALFYLFAYNPSFNIIRQIISISISILAFHYLFKNNNLKSFILIIAAMGFHKTSVISLLLYFIFILFKKLNDNRKKILKIILYSSLLVFIIFFKQIVSFLYSSGIYPHGLLFLQVYSTSFDFSYIDTFTYLFVLFIYFKNSDIISESIYSRDFYSFLGISSILLLSLGWHIQYMERISYYLFYPFLLYAIPKIYSSENKKNLNFYVIALIIYFIIYWFVLFVILNVHNTIPYQFA